MDSARVLRSARRRAALSQRELARRAGVPQSAVARIENGTVVPRVDTLDRLLAVCGEALEARPRLGEGVDRTLIQEYMALSAAERLDAAASGANNFAKLLSRARRVR